MLHILGVIMKRRNLDVMLQEAGILNTIVYQTSKDRRQKTPGHF